MASSILMACQPQVVQVDVTRIVEVTPRIVNLNLDDQSDTNGEIMNEPVEVTRVINQEVTRVVTNTIIEEIVVEVTPPPLGSKDRPIQLLFSPVVDENIISERGQVLVEELTATTGLNYEIGILDDEESMVQIMCAAPGDTIGFMSAVGYAFAHQRCGAQIGSVATLSDGFTWQAGMIVTRRDSGIASIEDLAGKRWAVPDTHSITRFLFFQALLAEMDIEVGEIVSVPGDSSAMLALIDGEVDIATATYVPPVLPYDERPWQFGQDSPEIWRRVGLSPRRSPIGYVLVNGEPEFGGYRLRDARSRIFDIVPDVYDETFIVTLSDPIPNDTIVLGADFPLGTAREVMLRLLEFSGSEACISSLCSLDFYGWSGLEPSEDSAYEPLRLLIDSLNLTTGTLTRP